MMHAAVIVSGLVLLFPVTTSASAAPTDGERLYAQSCLACHGADGVGVMPGVRDLTEPEGALSKPDELLFLSIRDGIQSADGALAMPARGGNSGLTEADIHALINFLRKNFGPAEARAQPIAGNKP